MTVSVEIPLSHYQALIGRCDLDSREYHVLRNAIIHHVPEDLRDGNVAILLCSDMDARLLLRRAEQFYPIAASYIAQALRSAVRHRARAAAPRSTAPGTKTLGAILFADSSKIRVCEDEWLELVRAVADGDECALYSLYARTCRIVFTLMTRIAGSRQTAEELTLDTFHDVWRKSQTYDSAYGSVAGWIMNQARAVAMQRQTPGARSFVAWSTDILRPPDSLWGRLAIRLAAEADAKRFVRALEAPVEPEWEQAAPGIGVKILARNTGADTVSMLVRLAPKTEYPGHTHAGVEELHLLHGILGVDDRALYPGDFIHSEAGSVDHRVWSDTGCTCFLMTSTNDSLF